MRLDEITYELLLIVRGGNISDDERIELRLLEQLVRQYREDYIVEYNRINKSIPESFVQSHNVSLSSTIRTTYKSLESSDSVPKIVIGKFGPIISGIYSPYVDEFSYTIVGRNQLKSVGNGKFNKDIIYVSYFDNRLVFKSQNQGYQLMTDVDVAAVYSDPEDLDEFDVLTDEYPVDSTCVDYIKEQFFKNDLKLLLQQISDEVNDASGEIEG